MRDPPRVLSAQRLVRSRAKNDVRSEKKSYNLQKSILFSLSRINRCLAIIIVVIGNDLCSFFLSSVKHRFRGVKRLD
jgi:hypothetical protein